MFLTKKTKKQPESKTVVDEKKIDEFLSRGVENIFPNKDFVRALFLKGEPLSMYLGIDPTGPTLHMGHAIILKKLSDFQNLGHKVILLIGDFTAMIGDPTDKTATRKMLTREEVLANASLYKKQAETFLRFTGPNPATIRYNSTWLAKMNFGDVLNLASKVTVEQMLKRDMFEKRMTEGKPIFIHEFLYPLLQGYDSVAMEVDGEIGGNDQTFNMLIGRDLSKSLIKKEKFVIASKLLVDPQGKKMGKTEGNMVSLDQSPEEMFGKILSWTDDLIIPAFELCTHVSLTDIESMRDMLSNQKVNPKELKVRLAKEVVAMYHGKDAADNAALNFEKVFKSGQLPEDIKTVVVNKGASLADVLLAEKLVESKSDFRRLIESGGIHETATDTTITDPHTKVEEQNSYRIGKKRFIKIDIK